MIGKNLVNRITGITGVFLKEFTNCYGEAIIVLTEDGREYYAPKHEWVVIKKTVN